MHDTALLLARSIKLLAEVAMLAAIGQWCLARLIGAQRAGNPFHGLLHTITSPMRWVMDRLLPARWPRGWRVAMAALLLLAVWVAALAWKVSLCRARGGCG